MNQQDAVKGAYQAIMQNLGKTDPKKAEKFASMVEQDENLQQMILAVAQDPKLLEQAIKATEDYLGETAQMAKKGTKIQYLNKLKKRCPEGQEFVISYNKYGGFVSSGCKECEAKNSVGTKKIEESNKVDKKKKALKIKVKKKLGGGDIAEEKCGGKVKK